MMSTYENQPVQLNMPSGSGSRPVKQSARSSSRRGAGSTAPKVVLGGGAGALGGGNVGAYGESPLLGYLSDKDASEKQSPRVAFPVQFPSPTTPTFSPPSSSKLSTPIVLPSPSFPSHTSAQYQQGSISNTSISSTPSGSTHISKSIQSHQTRPSSSSKASSSKTPSSSASLSTTASTSSGNLKTPQSKLDHPEVEIGFVGSGTNSTASHETFTSPTPTVGNDTRFPNKKETPGSPTLSKPRKSSLGGDQNQPISQPSFAARNESKDSAVRSKSRTRGPPPPLEFNSNRLSQDWVNVSSSDGLVGPSPPRPPRPDFTRKSTGSTPPLGSSNRLQPTHAVPIKSSAGSPLYRPSFDRSQTDPLSSGKEGKPHSFDQLRTGSPSLMAEQRKRMNSMSTPPSNVLNGPGKYVNDPFRTNKMSAGPEKELKSRKSADMLRRPSMDIFSSDKKSKASMGLGTSPQGSPIEKNEKEEKKQGLSLKKSSGALKALFNRGASAKGKDKEMIPAMPVMPNIQDIRDKEKKMGKQRPSTADSPASQTGPTFGRPRTPLYGSPLISQGNDDRRSLALDRRIPTLGQPINQPPVMLRTQSDSATTTLSATYPGEGQRVKKVSRDLPPLPPSSPLPQDNGSRNSTPRLQSSGNQVPSVGTGHKEQMQVIDPYKALGSSGTDTSLAYMARGSVYNAVGDDSRPLSLYRDETSVLSSGDLKSKISPNAYIPQTTSSPPAVKQQRSELDPSIERDLEFGLPTVKSLHLLALPDLDLKFDVSFDSIGQAQKSPSRSSDWFSEYDTARKESKSPTTPRRNKTISTSSPQRSPVNFKIQSPSRSRTVRTISPIPPNSASSADTFGHGKGKGKEKEEAGSGGLKVRKEERRRSKSFDGANTFSAKDLWREKDSDDGFISKDHNKLFATPISSSAPLLSKQLQGSPIPPSDFDSTVNHVNAAETIEKGRTEGKSSRMGKSISLESQESQRSLSSDGEAGNSSVTTPSPSSSPKTSPESFKGVFEAVNPDTMPTAGDKGKGKEIEDRPASPIRIDFSSPPTTATAVLESAPTIIEATSPKPRAPLAEPDVPALAEIKEVVPVNTNPVRPTPPEPRPRELSTRSRPIYPDQNYNRRFMGRELDKLLSSFRYPSHQMSGAERANMIRTDLLSIMSELEKWPLDGSGTARDEQANIHLRESCFGWVEALLWELRVEQAANERGACLEGLGAVLESVCLSDKALSRSPSHKHKFTQAMIKCMSFVMTKLGAKGVFHNTLLFSGRFLAFAFFRIPHVAEQLVSVLQPPRGALMRFTRSLTLEDTKLPESAQPKYPNHLSPLSFDNSRSYAARLSSLSPNYGSDQERAAFLFQPGNWLRRWQSDDSELFPAFYRAYHRQLALYLAPAVEYFETLNQPLPASVLVKAPGYAHLATIFATKCHSYILGSVNAVTTSSSSNNFDAQESAAFRGSQKPPVLETANRRLVETISTFSNAKIVIPSNKGRMIEVDGSQLWSDMINFWTKNLITKTSLYAPKGVFSLFDLLDGIVDPPYVDPTLMTQVDINKMESLLDTRYLIHVIGMILNQGEHALTLVKVIAFVFTHWEVLTARCDDRKELTLGLLLKKELFERLLLFWSQSVRSYVLRLVVFRLGHLHTKKEDGEAYEIEIESVKLLQTRLERIKKRHDELEPKPPSDDGLPDHKEDLKEPLTPVDGTLRRSRSTITMVQDSPSSGYNNKAERLLGLGFGIENNKDEEGKNSIGKATNWFKKKVGTKKSKKEGGTPGSRSASPSPSLDSSPLFGGSPKFGSPMMLNLNGNNKSTPRLLPKSGLASPLLPTSPSDSSSSDSPKDGTMSSMMAAPSPSDMRLKTGAGTGRKAAPPTIMTTPHSPEMDKMEKRQLLPSRSPVTPTNQTHGNSNGGGFAFEFELPTASPRSDSFDPSPLPVSPRRNSQPPSPGSGGTPASPHMSRSFSKRSSLLPPNTASALDAIMEDEKNSKNARVSRDQKEVKLEKVQDNGYDAKYHAYAIRMLAELEDAQKEYDEWWSETGIGRMDGAPPRLAVAWPFHDGDD